MVIKIKDIQCVVCGRVNKDMVIPQKGVHFLVERCICGYVAEDISKPIDGIVSLKRKRKQKGGQRG